VGALTTWSAVLSSGVDTVNGLTAAIKTDGTIWVTGAKYATNPPAVPADTSTFTQQGIFTTWSKVACCNQSIIATKTDGTLWSWGVNSFGELGLSPTFVSARSSPTQVGALTIWNSVFAGNTSVFATTTSGTLWAWGQNTSGILGIGTTLDRSSPVQVGALTTWSSVSVNTVSNVTAAIKTDGTLWTWGLGTLGTLGLGDILSRSSPVQVGALTNWATVKLGMPTSGLTSSMAMATKTDGTLWMWGTINTLGYSAAFSSPVQVGSSTSWGYSAPVLFTGGTPNAMLFLAPAPIINNSLWVWGADNGGGYAVPNAPNVLGLGTTTGSMSSPVQVGQ
jgi:alpha-tubulin suppressor-like RCC1 family protein